MKKIFIGLMLVVLLWSAPGVVPAQTNNQITLKLTDRQKIHEFEMGPELLLRVIKDSSVKHKHFGWIIEVVGKSGNRTNLIYQNETGTTADLSQVYAWHIGAEEFPNRRELTVKGYPLTVRINLKDPRVKGAGPDARFTSGKLEITWD